MPGGGRASTNSLPRLPPSLRPWCIPADTAVPAHRWSSPTGTLPRMSVARPSAPLTPSARCRRPTTCCRPRAAAIVPAATTIHGSRTSRRTATSTADEHRHRRSSMTVQRRQPSTKFHRPHHPSTQTLTTVTSCLGGVQPSDSYRNSIIVRLKSHRRNYNGFLFIFHSLLTLITSMVALAVGIIVVNLWSWKNWVWIFLEVQETIKFAKVQNSSGRTVSENSNWNSHQKTTHCCHHCGWFLQYCLRDVDCKAFSTVFFTDGHASLLHYFVFTV